MVAAAIVHARRLAAQNVKLAPRQVRWNDAEQVRKPPEKRKPALALGETGARLWSAQEYHRYADAANIDELAQCLWQNWLAPYSAPRPESAPDVPVAGMFNVTSVDADLVAIGNEAPQTIEFVEVSSVLFQAFCRQSGTPLLPAMALAEQRLRMALRQADAIMICLPSNTQWDANLRTGVGRLVAAARDGRRSPAETILALTKADIVLAEEALTRQACVDPKGAAGQALAEELMGREESRKSLWQSIRSMDDIAVRLCSSYGVLRMSGTANIDLSAARRPVDRLGAFAPTVPLWPEPSLDVTSLVPSEPTTLRHWRPVGVLEAVIGGFGEPARQPADRLAV